MIRSKKLLKRDQNFQIWIVKAIIFWARFIKHLFSNDDLSYLAVIFIFIIYFVRVFIFDSFHFKDPSVLVLWCLKTDLTFCWLVEKNARLICEVLKLSHVFLCTIYCSTKQRYYFNFIISLELLIWNEVVKNHTVHGFYIREDVKKKFIILLIPQISWNVVLSFLYSCKPYTIGENFL